MSYSVISSLDIDRWANEFPESNKIIPAFVYAEIVKEAFHGENADPGLLMPWSKTHQHIKLRPGELSVWAGVNGSGKSMLLSHVMLEAQKAGERVCIASFEMKPHKTMMRMNRQAIGVNCPSPEFIDEFHEWTDGKLWLYDQQGTVTPKQVMAVIRYCSYGHMDRGNKTQITHMVVDSLLKVGIDEDDYNAQKRFVNDLHKHAQDSGMHIHLVCHARKGESEMKMLDKFDIKGTGAITDQADNVFIVWRNKRKEAEAQKNQRDPEVMKEPDCILNCNKQRNGEWEGKIGLYFHAASLQYTAQEGRPIPYVQTRTMATHQIYEPGTGDIPDFDESYVR